MLAVDLGVSLHCPRKHLHRPTLPSPVPTKFRSIFVTQNIRASRHALRQQTCASSSKPRQHRCRLHAAKVGEVISTIKEATSVSNSVAEQDDCFDLKQTVLVQGFGWDSCTKGAWYNQVRDAIPELKAAGVSHLWLPPPSQSVSKQGYLPGQLYNLSSAYGNKEELLALNKALWETGGIRPVADIVINHRCADEQDENGVWNSFRDDVDHEGRSIDWGKWAITSNDPDFQGKGNPDSGEDYGPAPDLDHTNEELRRSLIDWMKWLKRDIGFAGWRFDFVKGYGAQYLKEYVESTGMASNFNVGEYWVDSRWNGSDLEYDQNAPRQVLCDWLDAVGGVCSLFDFPTKGILQEAVKRTQYWRLRDKDGKPPGLIGWWPSKAVTFVDNHDTGSTQQHWPFPGDKIMCGYAYILTHPGMPCIFWDHLFQFKDQISQLIHLRARTGTNADSPIKIVAADEDMYVAYIGDRVALKLGPKYDAGDVVPKESDGWKKAVKGPDFCVWEKE